MPKNESVPEKNKDKKPIVEEEDDLYRGEGTLPFDNGGGRAEEGEDDLYRGEGTLP